MHFQKHITKLLKFVKIPNQIQCLINPFDDFVEKYDKHALGTNYHWNLEHWKHWKHIGKDSNQLK